MQWGSCAIPIMMFKIYTKVPYNIQPLESKKMLMKIATAQSTKGYKSKNFKGLIVLREILYADRSLRLYFIGIVGYLMMNLNLSSVVPLCFFK